MTFLHQSRVSTINHQLPPTYNWAVKLPEVYLQGKPVQELRTVSSPQFLGLFCCIVTTALPVCSLSAHENLFYPASGFLFCLFFCVFFVFFFLFFYLFYLFFFNLVEKVLMVTRGLKHMDKNPSWKSSLGLRVLWGEMGKYEPLQHSRIMAGVGVCMKCCARKFCWSFPELSRSSRAALSYTTSCGDGNVPYLWAIW